MSIYNRLDKYIKYFSDTDKEFSRIVSGYRKYDDELYEFIDEVYESDLIKYDYRPYLESLEYSKKILDIVGTEEIKEYIDKADIETVKALLTYYVRWHRFDDDVWEWVAKEGIFHKLLIRIKGLFVEGGI